MSYPELTDLAKADTGVSDFIAYQGWPLNITEGERPEVVTATGGRLRLVQLGAVVTGAGLAGVGGAQLSIGGDVALAAEVAADGVHLSAGGSIAAARTRLGARMLVGISAHGEGDVAAA